jgi:hypothetical protein
MPPITVIMKKLSAPLFYFGYSLSLRAISIYTNPEYRHSGRDCRNLGYMDVKNPIFDYFSAKSS